MWYDSVFLACYFKRRNTRFCKLDPRPKLCIWSCRLWAFGGSGECSPSKVTKAVNNQCQGGWELSDAKIRGHKQAASISSPSVTWFHTPPHVGTMRFFSVSCFLSVHTSSFCNEIQLHPNKQILKESFAFSQMMDMLSLYSITAEVKVHIS